MAPLIFLTLMKFCWPEIVFIRDHTSLSLRKTSRGVLLGGRGRRLAIGFGDMIDNWRGQIRYQTVDSVDLSFLVHSMMIFNVQMHMYTVCVYIHYCICISVCVCLYIYIYMCVCVYLFLVNAIQYLINILWLLVFFAFSRAWQVSTSLGEF